MSDLVPCARCKAPTFRAAYDLPTVCGECFADHECASGPVQACPDCWGSGEQCDAQGALVGCLTCAGNGEVAARPCSDCGAVDCKRDHEAEERDEQDDYERAHGPEVSK